MKKRIIAVTLTIISLIGILGVSPVRAFDIMDLFQGDSITNEQAEVQFQRLVEQAINYCRNGDYNAFASLFRNTDDNTIDYLYQCINNLIECGYPDYDYIV